MYTAYVGQNLLYSPALVHEGYAILDPVISWELNKVPTFRFTVPPTNEQYADIERLKSIITVREDGNIIFRGRVLDDEFTFNNMRKVYCEGDMAFLRDTIVEPYQYSGTMSGLFTQLITAHNARSVAGKQFVVGNVTVKAEVQTSPKDFEVLRSGSKGPEVTVLQERLASLSYTVTVNGKYDAQTEAAVMEFQGDKGLVETGVYDSVTQRELLRAIGGREFTDHIEANISDCNTTFDEIQQRMIDVYGGYLFVRYVNDTAYIDYLADSGDINSEVIEFGQNLLDFSQTLDAKEVYTVILPEGKERDNPVDGEINRLRVTDINGNSPYIVNAAAVALFGRIEKHVVWDDIEVAEELLQTGTEELQNNIAENMTVNVDAVALKMLTGDTVKKLILGGYNRMISVPHHVDAYLQCSRIELNLQNAAKTKFIFGFVPVRITDVKRTKRGGKYVTEATYNTLVDRVSALEGN